MILHSSLRIAALLAAVLLPAVLLPVAAAADGGDVFWIFQGIEDIHCLAELPDQDGDLRPEILIESYDAGADGDHLYCVSGGVAGTPAVLWSARPSSGASDGGGYGDDCLIAAGDLSGDGYPDAVLGTAWGNRSVHAMDGLSGELLWTFDTYEEVESGWVYSVCAFPDRTGDGLPEIACAVGSDNNNGYLLDGADGSELFAFFGSSDALFAVRAGDDADGDDVADLYFAAGDYDTRVFCVSGASEAVGQQVWETDTGGSNYALAPLEDLNGDGVADLAVGSWTPADQLRALDGATGATLWTFHNGSYQYIMRLVRADDADGDGTEDIAVGSWDNALRLVSGRDGSLIWESWAGTTNGGDFWAVDRVDDLTGDGVDEVAGASFDTQVYLFDGADGDTLWMQATGRRHYTVRGVGDLSGSGGAHVVAGQQYMGGGGRAYALEGGTATAVEDWPPVSGSAIATPSAGAILDWSCREPLPFHVERLVEAAGRAAGRRLIAKALQRCELRTREALALIREQEEPGWIRLNAEALAGEPAGAGYAYRFRDPEGFAGARYRLVARWDGSERILAELSAGAEDGRPPLIANAGLHPNPFNPTCTLRFDLAAPASLRLVLHDGRGRLLERGPWRAFPAGSSSWCWTAPAGLASGVYFLTLEGGGSSRSFRAVLIQ